MQRAATAQRGPTKHDDDRIALTHSQILLGFLLTLGAIILTILITYNLTCPSHSLPDEHGGIATSSPPVKPSSPDQPVIPPGPTAKELRLPKDLTPWNYTLRLKVHVPGFVSLPPPKKLTLDGDLTIRFRVHQPTNSIVVNALKLTFDDYKNYEVVAENSQRVLRVVSATVTESLEKVIFELDGELLAEQTYQFKLTYSGPISTTVLSGMYQSQYTGADGETRYLATTQMEPVGARRMVPCFDEPEMKATWSVSVTHPRGSTAIGNGIELRKDEPTNDPDWLLTEFAETPRMSSYLLAVIVSDFAHIEGRTNKNTLFRIWARKEALNQTTFALKAGIASLQYFEDYYGIAFPLPKQDMVAVPDFKAGAMENWGLVTYRETALLFDPKFYSSELRLRVAEVIVHELSHQWFGNLVTMHWWSDLWLNEGFAALLQFQGLKAVMGDAFDEDQLFVGDSLSTALRLDIYASTHPLVNDVQRTADLEAAFDGITYKKGSSVLRMIQAVLGKDNFRKGLQIYLKRHQYGNTNHDDLWNALSEAVPSELVGPSGRPLNVTEFAASWTEQNGYPLISVRRTAERVELRQNWYSPHNTNSQKRWLVPIWYTIDGRPQPLTWLDGENIALGVPENALLVINSDSLGYYRVQYDAPLMKRIATQLLADHEKITVKSRGRIVEDTFALAKDSHIPYDTALNLTRYLPKELEYLPWSFALAGLDTVGRYFGDEPELTNYREFMSSLLENLFRRISFDEFGVAYTDDEYFFQRLLDAAIVSKSCKIGKSTCIEHVLDVWQDSFMGPCADSPLMSSQCSSAPVAIRKLLYCLGVRYGTEREFDVVLSKAKQEVEQVEKTSLLYSAACTFDTYAFKRLMAVALSLNDTTVRLQDKPMFFKVVATFGPVARRTFVEYVCDHWPTIYRTYEDYREVLSAITGVLADSDSSERETASILAFAEQYANTDTPFDAQLPDLLRTRASGKARKERFEMLNGYFIEQHRQRSTPSRLRNGLLTTKSTSTLLLSLTRGDKRTIGRIF